MENIITLTKTKTIQKTSSFFFVNNKLNPTHLFRYEYVLAAVVAAKYDGED